MRKICSILAGIMILAVAFAASACSPKEAVATPAYYFVDDTLYWEPVENAIGYVVAVNGAEQPQQTANYYKVDSTVETSVRVKAIANSDYRDSVYGAAAIREADPALTELTQEAFNALLMGDDTIHTGALPAGGAAGYSVTFTDPTHTYNFIIPSSVQILRVKADYGDEEEFAHVNFCATLATRSTPFILEIQGASLIGLNDLSVINASEAKVSGGAELVIRSLKGKYENAIGAGRSTKTGSDGAAGGDSLLKPKPGGNGGKGGDGPDAIKAERVAIMGDAPITIAGGEGAQGGKGGRAKGNNGGDGGNGGAGGSAITGIAYICTTGQPVTLIGGKGGAGGPYGSGFLDFSPTNGKTGATGKQAADTVVISGELK